ncbi:FecR domain-containing protein [Dyadobacter sp. CY261]|uniref:FecR family protein n=1 Tax=Dyadobacter sp. CY261 TaxID=2907203 RepID=UPI001F241E35|nr:FecR domain-containing protein [Dyadobacter sp. CY261]MCF0070743.1 FecR domain-containing protein [Dyadobacter sp. CY261]
MKPNGIPPALLEKYLSGECTDAEKELVENWYASLKGEPRYLDHLPDVELDEVRQETFGNIRRELNMADERPVRRLPWHWLAGIAASVLVALGIYLAGNLKTVKLPEVTVKGQKPDPSKALPVTTFKNTGTQIVRHELPDGSVVTMHPKAEIMYRAAFANNKRFVVFSGEGFFDVKKDKTRPFNIKSGDMVIRVLGTSFNVKAIESQKKFQVDVVTGSVQVTAFNEKLNKQEVILKPQQQALFELDSKRLTYKTLPPQSKKELYEPVTIVFEETPLNKVIEQLEKRFNVSLTLANPGLAKCGLTANFESQSFPNILEILCTSLDVTYTISNNNITISGEPCE